MTSFHYNEFPEEMYRSFISVLQVVVIEYLGDKADQDQDLDMVENDREVLAAVVVDLEAGVYVSFDQR